MILDEKMMAFVALIWVIVCIYAIWNIFIKKEQARTLAQTPVTEAGLRQYDSLPPAMAVAHAWSDAGNQPHYHRMMQDNVRAEMPLLARALDRLVED